MNIERTLSTHASTVTFEQIGDAGVEAAKRATLDTIGCIIAASRAPGIDILVELATMWGGKGEAAVIGRNLSTPAPVAAWVNGSMARALEIDDCTDFLPLHPSAALVPSLLAMAEARPPLTGREFLTALAIGQDLILRFGTATRLDGIQSGRYNLFKIFGIVAATSHVLRLDPARTQHAMGIAYSLACGEGQSAVDGALAFRTHEGNAGQAAITATLMAERGFTGAENFLTGRMGFFTSFEPEANFDALTDDLARRFRGDEISFKPYSACRCTHTAIDLVLNYRRTPGATTDRLKSIHLTVAPAVHKLVGAQFETGAEAGRQAAAQFSLPYTVAAALVCGDVFLDQFTPVALINSEILALARRVTVTPDESMRDEHYVIGRTRIDLEFDGRPSVRLEGIEPLGNPSNPVSRRQAHEKFRKCAAAAPHPIPDETVESLIDGVSTLEALSDVSEFVRDLRG